MAKHLAVKSLTAGSPSGQFCELQRRPQDSDQVTSSSSSLTMKNLMLKVANIIIANKRRDSVPNKRSQSAIRSPGEYSKGSLGRGVRRRPTNLHPA